MKNTVSFPSPGETALRAEVAVRDARSPYSHKSEPGRAQRVLAVVSNTLPPTFNLMRQDRDLLLVIPSFEPIAAS